MNIRSLKQKVLITDDDMAQRLIIRMSLEEEGYEVKEASNGLEALVVLAEDPDIRLLITDIDMPEMNGYDLISAVRGNELRYTYIIVLTSREEREPLIKALSLGADEYLTKPVFQDELKLRMTAGRRLLSLESHEQLIFSMAKLTEYRSEETGFHLERTLRYTKLLAVCLSKSNPELNLTMGAAEEIARVSTLHDIGKVGIYDQILNKPGKLNSEEFEIMKKHSEIGGKMIKEIYDKNRSPALLFAYEIAMYHHERWNGMGYPYGLSGTEIPMAARIMAVADVYDALCSVRCYKPAFPHEEAKALIISESGQHFDPAVVQAFLNLESEWLAIKNTFRDEYLN